VESINGDGSSKGRRRSDRFMRGNEEEAAARTSGGGRRPGRWAKRAGSAEWASLAAGLAKGFGPNSCI
jgi:hypothetical protein